MLPQVLMGINTDVIMQTSKVNQSSIKYPLKESAEWIVNNVTIELQSFIIDTESPSTFIVLYM